MSSKVSTSIELVAFTLGSFAMMADGAQESTSYYKEVSIVYDDGTRISTVVSRPIVEALSIEGQERMELLKQIRENYENARMNQVEPDTVSVNTSKQTCTNTQNNTQTENSMNPSTGNQGGSGMKQNERFSHEQTLYFIELMRSHLQKENMMPTSLSDLERKIKLTRRNKKAMRITKAKELTEKFSEVFGWEKVGRKWQKLLDGYKNAKDNAKTTGRGTTNFHYFDAMYSLLGNRHDVEPPVTGTAQGVVVHRPEQLDEQTGDIEDSQAAESASSSTDSPQGSLRRKRKASSVLEYLKQADEEARTDRQAMINQMQTATHTTATHTFERIATILAECFRNRSPNSESERSHSKKDDEDAQI